MPRPRNRRRVGCLPQSSYYKPRGIPLSTLQHVTLTVGELEAIRLTDVQKLYQEDAAEKMNISRQTLGRILDSAHRKIADALVNGKALIIEGGQYELDPRIAQTIPPPPHRLRRGRGGPRHRGGRGPRQQ